MNDALNAVLDGTVGFFWTAESADRFELVDDTAEAGSVQLRESGLELLLLDEDPMAERALTPVVLPYGLVGATPATGLVALDITRTNKRLSLGGSRASVRSYLAQTVLTHPRLDAMDRLMAAELAAVFSGEQMLGWAGLTTMTETPAFDSEARLERLTIELGGPDQRLETRLAANRSLSLDAHWGLDRTGASQRLIDIGLEVGVTSTRPVELSTLMDPVVRVQALLGLLFNGVVKASDARVQFMGGDPRIRGHLWNSALMGTRVPPETEADTSRHPAMTLEDLGGIRALGRWNQLWKRHPRAVGPLVNHLRWGSASVETRLLELAAAIEYWVATHRRTTQWACRGVNFAHALALRVGRSFDDWCGDSGRWAADFTRHYNGLKHEPRFRYDPTKVVFVALAGEVLLKAALLDRVGASKRPSTALLGSPDLHGPGRRLREYVAGRN